VPSPSFLFLLWTDQLGSDKKGWALRLSIWLDSTIPNTLSVNCKLTRLRYVLLGFLISKLAKAGSLFSSQFTLRIFPLACHCLIWKLKHTWSMSHNNNDYGGRGPSLLLSHSTSGTVGRLVGFFLWVALIAALAGWSIRPSTVCCWLEVVQLILSK